MARGNFYNHYKINFLKKFCGWPCYVSGKEAFYKYTLFLIKTFIDAKVASLSYMVANKLVSADRAPLTNPFLFMRPNLNPRWMIY